MLFGQRVNTNTRRHFQHTRFLTNAATNQNVIDLSRAVRALIAEGYPVKHEVLTLPQSVSDSAQQAVQR